MAEDATVTPTRQSYASRLEACYKFLTRSRVVKKGETDADALEYFARFCNDALPAANDLAEHEFRKHFRDLYHKNKKLYHDFVVATHPYLILLTEARAIVTHFKVDNLIYINWEGDRYRVVVNKRFAEPTPPAADAEHKTNRANTRRPTRSPKKDELVEKLTKQVEELATLVKKSTEKPTEPAETDAAKNEDPLNFHSDKNLSWADQ